MEAQTAEWISLLTTWPPALALLGLQIWWHMKAQERRDQLEANRDQQNREVIRELTSEYTKSIQGFLDIMKDHGELLSRISLQVADLSRK